MKRIQMVFTGLMISFACEINAGPLFEPGVPCSGCEINIIDHKGVDGTDKNAVFEINNPKTPKGIAPFLQIYHPKRAIIEKCVEIVRSVEGNPMVAHLVASEYTLSGSDQVVFLVKECEMDPRGGMSKEGMPADMEKFPRLDGGPVPYTGTSPHVSPVSDDCSTIDELAEVAGLGYRNPPTDEETACCVMEHIADNACLDRPSGEERDACINQAGLDCGLHPNDLIDMTHY